MHAGGHRFDSDILHFLKEVASVQKSKDVTVKAVKWFKAVLHHDFPKGKKFFDILGKQFKLLNV